MARLGWLREINADSRIKLYGLLADYLKQDQLQDYRAYPKQMEFHNNGNRYRNRMLSAGNQNGKGVRFDQFIPTPEGFVRMDELHVGDRVIGSDGKPTEVVGVFPQGIRPCYEVTVSDGATLIVDDQHLWTVRKARGHSTNKAKWQLRRTDEMLSGTRWELPQRPVVHTDRGTRDIDPYLLGLILGDGSISTRSVGITSADQEIIRFIEEIAAQYDCVARMAKRAEGEAPAVFLRKLGDRNRIVGLLDDLNLMGRTSADKHIPAQYLFAPPEERMTLLQGLMDSDGCAVRMGGREFGSVSYALASGVLHLARSLGMAATLKRKKGRYKGAEHWSWRVRIGCGGPAVFRLERKRAQEEEHRRVRRHVLIRSIEPIEAAETICIRVANEDGIFLAGKGFIPTHNSYSAGAEIAMHLTGEYPESWKGKRFNRPVVVWAASKTGEQTRDTVQRVLLGDAKQFGTGMIPKRALVNGMRGMAKGITGLLDFQYVHHVSGGMSMLKLRNYAQGREAWQGPPVDVVWLDEESPMEIYEESLARTIATKGITMITFTPLLGYTHVVNLYLRDPDPEHSGRKWTRMTLHDALHLTEEEIKSEIAKWPIHQRQARIEGLPAMGVGQIFPYQEEEITCKPFEIPEHYQLLAGIDIGGSSHDPKAHPTAAVKIAYDRDEDIIYVTAEYRRKGLKPPEHWIALRRWGKVSWAWPKDAMAHEKGTGAQVMVMYKNEGMNTLAVHAQYPKSTRKNRRQDVQANTSAVSVERGVTELQVRFENNGIKIFENCTMLLEEVRQYHRDDDGKIVKSMDDLIDALRYATMMLRFAKNSRPVNIDSTFELDPMLGF